jgi:hypothetical protein
MGRRDFYGGWITSNIKGRMKGGECLIGVAIISILMQIGAGTWGW